jgi:hypothetical protein
MAVSVRIVGDVARLAGAERFDIDRAGCTLAAAIEELVERHPRLAKELFDEKGRVGYSWVLAMDGSRAVWPRDKERLIPDGGELLVTRFYGGG